MMIEHARPGNLADSLDSAMLERLHNLGDAGIVQLRAFVADPKEKADVRAGSIRALAVLQAEAAGELATLLKDREPKVRREVAHALAWLKSVDAIEPLIGALQDSDEATVVAAANALGQIGDARATQPLLSLLGKDGEVGTAARDALQSCGRQDLSSSLLPLLNSELPQVRARAAWLLAQFPNELATEKLISLRRDISPEVRSAAVRAIGGLRNDRYLDEIESALSDRNYEVRKSAIAALGSVGTERSARVLVRAFREDETVRIDAVRAMRSMKFESVVRLLIAALSDEDRIVRDNAAEALGTIGDVRASKALIDGLEKPERRLGYSAIIALGRLRAEGAVHVLATIVENGNIAMSLAAVWALGQIGTPEALEALRSAQNDPRREVRDTASESLRNVAKPE
jgi:HEAT repeat protein